MVDLHSHILPGIDDGPATMGDSVALARALHAEGVKTVAATPHIRADYPDVVPRELATRCEQLRECLTRQGVGLHVVSGGEVDLVWMLDASSEDLAMVSFGQTGSDLLVECPYGPLTSFFEEQLFRLATGGYRVLLAHPERNPTFQEDPDRLRTLVDRGVLVQLTAVSVVGPHRKSRSARAAHRFLTDGLAHVIASDSHGSALARPLLGSALQVARGIVGQRADWMVSDAPSAILAGQALPPPPPLPPPLRRWRQRFSR